MKLFIQVFLYSIIMAVLSFLAGLPAFWILSKSHSALSIMMQLTSGLLLSTCFNIVLPESFAHIPLEQLQSSSFGPKILLGFVALYSLDSFSTTIAKFFDHSAIDLDSDEIDISMNQITSAELASYQKYILSVLSNSTTLGLILHCLTDGIILTTSLLSQEHNDSSNAFLIIISIFLHKLPASFSLTSILLNEKLHFKTVLFHLTMFSVSAPIGAFVTYLASHVFAYSDPNKNNSFVLLFSAGAFLYVGFHSFLSCHKHGNGDTSKNEDIFASWSYLSMMMGMLIPVLLSLLHDD